MALAPTVPAAPGAQGWDEPPKDSVIGWAVGGNTKIPMASLARSELRCFPAPLSYAMAEPQEAAPKSTFGC